MHKKQITKPHKNSQPGQAPMPPIDRKIALPALLGLILLLSACAFFAATADDQVALGVAQTQVVLTQSALTRAALTRAAPEQAGQDPVVQPPEAQDAGSTNPDSPPPAPTHTPSPTITPSPTLTLTPTQTLTSTLSVPMVTVSRGTHCRTGPGDPYDIVGELMVNEEAEVVGVSPDGGTWIIKNPDGPGECWLWGYYAAVTGPTAGLPVYPLPPTPTPQFLWAGTWDTINYPVGGMGLTLTLTTSVNGKNFSGTMTIPGVAPVLLSGTISNDWLSVSGTWTSSIDNGTFKFFAVGTNRFNGSSRNGELKQWCGVRGGGAFPDPCFRE